ncbi:MAG: hypothetical protein ACI902_002985 [Psychroserpens sp.]|jgi:uncharacterized protein YbbC (DUF1343 family)
MELKEIKKEIDSIKTDIQKFNGNPAHAIIDAWDKKVDVLLKYSDLFEQEFNNELIAFKLKVRERYPNETTDIGEQLNTLRTSIYKLFKESKEDLSNVNIVIYDLQDVGCRFYTNINALAQLMEACYENEIKLIILDRPNPNGYLIDGPVLETKYKSGIGIFPHLCYMD